MSARRLILATVIPAALLAGPVAGAASADTLTPTDISETPGSVTFAAAAQGTTPITRIEVDLPTGTPMRDVTVPDTAGWTTATTKAALPSCGDEVVNSVTWTATGGGVASQQTGSFAIQVGSFPKTDQMEFTGTVTYADGEVVPWTQEQGTRIPAFAQNLPSTTGTTSAVTVSARSTAPRPAVATEPQPVAPTASTTPEISVSSWFNTMVKTMVSFW